MLRPRSTARVGADDADTLSDRKLWYYDPDSVVEIGKAPNGFRIFRATLVDSIKMSDDTKKIAAVEYVENGPVPGYGKGNGEISKVLAASAISPAPKTGDWVQDALPRSGAGKKASSMSSSGEASGETPLVMIGLAAAIGAILLLR